MAVCYVLNDLISLFIFFLLFSSGPSFFIFACFLHREIRWAYKSENQNDLHVHCFSMADDMWQQKTNRDDFD